MSFPSSLKRVIKISLSLGLAWPFTAGARDYSQFNEFSNQVSVQNPRTLSDNLRAAAAGDTAASYTEFTLPNGRRAYAFVAQIPDKDARQTFHNLAKANAGHFGVGTAGPRDEVTQWAQQESVPTGRTVQVIDDLSTMAAFQRERDIPLKARFVEKVRSMATEVREQKLNTVAAIGYAGTVAGGEVFWVSGSVPAAAAVFTAIAITSVFTATQGDWEHIVEKVGNKSENGIAGALKAMGSAYEMGRLERRFVRGTGQFALMYGMSAAEVYGVTKMTGLHVEPMHIAISAFAYSYAAFDAVVMRWYHHNMISKTTKTIWFLTQYVGGTMAALAMYRHVEHVQTGLSIFVASALGYLWVGQYVEEAVRTARTTISFAYDNVRGQLVGSTVTPLKRRLAAARLANHLSKTNCEGLLSTAPSAWNMGPWRTQSMRPGI